jgi:MFS family permease
MERLILRFGWGRTLVSCLAISAAMLALLPTTATAILLGGIVAILGLAIGLTQPMTITWVANQAPRAERGTALAVRLTGNRLSLLFVPAVMGAVAGSAGVGAVFWVLAAALGLGAAVSRTGHLETIRSQQAQRGSTGAPDSAGAQSVQGEVAVGGRPEAGAGQTPG